MPTYEYVCRECGEQLEVIQSFSDDALSTCPACGGTLRKVFGNVGIVFKGSGFYKTDNRDSSHGGSKALAGATGSDSASSTASNDTGTDSGSSPSKSDAVKADSKDSSAPAPAASTTTSTGSTTATKPAAAAS